MIDNALHGATVQDSYRLPPEKSLHLAPVRLRHVVFQHGEARQDVDQCAAEPRELLVSGHADRCEAVDGCGHQQAEGELVLDLASAIRLPEVQDVDGNEHVPGMEAREDLTHLAAGYLEGLIKHLPSFIHSTLHCGREVRLCSR
ncbi:hypothetical protein D9M68_593370 [compost metagenome]